MYFSADAAARTVAQFGIQTGEFGNGISDPKVLPAGKVARGKLRNKKGDCFRIKRLERIRIIRYNMGDEN